MSSLFFSAFIAIALTACATTSIIAQPEARVLIVTTSHSALINSNTPTGYSLPDVVNPYYIFIQAGWTVDIASPAGNRPPVDERTIDTSDNRIRYFLVDTVLQNKLSSTLASRDVKPENYDVVLFAGGHGALWDFLADQHLHTLAAKVFGKRGIVATIGQGAAVLLNTKLSDGSVIYKSSRITSATDEEERARGLEYNLPYALETALRRGGGIIFADKPNAQNTVVEHRLITGQNSASARGVAQAVVAKWKELQTSK